MNGGGETLRGSAYPPAWHLVAAVLRVVSGASLPLLLFLLLTLNDPPISPPLLLRLFLLWTVAPACAAWLIRRAYAVEMRVNGPTLRVARRDIRIEIPISSIQRLVPWRVPLPAAGLSLQLQSGQRFRWGLVLDDPGQLLAALSVADPESTRAVAAHPNLVFARARAAHGQRRAAHLAAKFIGFALLPAAVLFYTHQHIAYGGTLGEYYLLGLGSYLTTFAVYWSTISIYLALFASVWRGVTEAVCLLTAWVAPRRALTVRRWAERACAILYYGGVPIVLALRYLE